MSEIINIGGLSAAPGQRVHGFISIGNGRFSLFISLKTILSIPVSKAFKNLVKRSLKSEFLFNSWWIPSVAFEVG